MDLGTVISKANKYKEVLENTVRYRQAWNDSIKPMLTSTMEEIINQLNLPKSEVVIIDNIVNLESIVLDLGKTSSGISENLEDTGVQRTMLKSNGALIYQQLFNGKIMVMIKSPNIEGYGEPKPPMMLEILRPDELKAPFILRHMEAFLKDITEWEDFDDEEKEKSNIGFTPIGFNQQQSLD